MKKVRGTLRELDGNAFMLMGHFHKLAREQGFQEDWIQSVLDEAKSSDYQHLINTLPDNMEE